MIKITKNKLTNMFLPQRLSKKPLKRSMSGYETEQFILNNKGEIDNSDILYKKAKEKNISAEKECAKSMIELSCLPAKKLKTTSQSLIENQIKLQEVAEKNNLILFPFGSYFGKNEPIFRRKEWYTIQSKILGEKRWKNAGLCCGVHQHYDLPKGVFDKKNKWIKELTNSKVNKTLVDCFNFIIAADPVLTCLTQSSPYLNYKSLGKDSRLISYRGGKYLSYEDGMYSKHRLFGALPHYKSTVKDIATAQKRRFEKWQTLVKEHGYDPSKHMKKEKMLAFNWTPIKINPHGTLEYRGYDMNYLSIIFGISTLLKFSLREIQQNFRMVVPLDIDHHKSFKIENNMIFIPSFSTVAKMQKKAAYKGLADEEVYTYVKNFYNFAKSITNKNYLHLLKPIEEMIENKKTMSDKIKDYFKRKGYKNELNKEISKEGAIKFSEDFKKDLKNIKEKIDKAEN